MINKNWSRILKSKFKIKRIINRKIKNTIVKKCWNNPVKIIKDYLLTIKMMILKFMSI